MLGRLHRVVAPGVQKSLAKGTYPVSILLVVLLLACVTQIVEGDSIT